MKLEQVVEQMGGRPYYVLAVNEEGQWIMGFGDYDRRTVRDEMQDYRDQGIRRKDMRVLTTADDQDSVQAAVDALNNPAPQGEGF